MTSRKPSARKKTKSKRMQLSIEVEDFGPISRGKVALKPLTLFIGPNNSGKSYLAMLVHSVFEAYSPTGLLRRGPLYMRRGFLTRGLDIGLFSKQWRELKTYLGDSSQGRKVDIPQEFIQKITRKVLRDIREQAI